MSLAAVLHVCMVLVVVAWNTRFRLWGADVVVAAVSSREGGSGSGSSTTKYDAGS